MTADAEAEAEIRRLADELFITTDLKDWTALRALFADGRRSSSRNGDGTEVGVGLHVRPQRDV